MLYPFGATRTAFLLVFIVFAFVAFSQPPGGGTFRPSQIKAEDIAELLILDQETVLKKSKIEADLAPTATQLTREYNKAIDSIAYMNTAILIQSNAEIRDGINSAMQTRNFQLMQTTMQGVMINLGPILREVQTVRTDYSSRMKAVLNEKSYKKFEKYLSGEVNALKPQTPGGGPPASRRQRPGGF